MCFCRFVSYVLMFVFTSACFGQPNLPDFSAATFTNSLNIDNPYHPLISGQARIYTEEEKDPETGEAEIASVIVGFKRNAYSCRRRITGCARSSHR